jgi:hypothetical protein
MLQAAGAAFSMIAKDPAHHATQILRVNGQTRGKHDRAGRSNRPGRPSA